jgi:hypothetical protein
MTFSWPAYFSDDCPPQDSQPASGEVYRLVKNDPPKEDDFLTHKELFPEKDFGDQECQACGVSVSRDADDIPVLKRRVPGLRERMLARGILDSSLGKIKSTPGPVRSHHTWWVPVGVQRHACFSVVRR